MPKPKNQYSVIPSLDNRGFLPPGIYDATLDDLGAAFCVNAVRSGLFPQFRRFLVSVLARVGMGLELYVCGSFLSDKSLPDDIDCTIEIPLSQVSSRIPLMQIFDDGRDPHTGKKGAIWDRWKVDIYPSIQASGHSDFVKFFQYVGIKAASLKNLRAHDRRGIVRVIEWTRG